MGELETIDNIYKIILKFVEIVGNLYFDVFYG